MANALKVVRALSVRWLWFYAASLLLFALSLIGWYEFTTAPTTDHFLNYQTLENLSSTALMLSFAFFVLGCLLFSLKRRKLLSGIVLFVLTLLGAIVILALIGPASSVPIHLDNKILNGYTYNLDVYYIPDPTYSVLDSSQFGHPFATEGLYLLYQCDSVNILCTSIYRKSFALPADMRGYKVQLLTTEAGQLSISMGGNIVFSYHLL